MNKPRKQLILSLGVGLVLTGACAALLAQSYQPGSATGAGEYFVTGDATHASLWQRDGNSLRWVADGDKSNRSMPGMKDPMRDPTTPHDPKRPGDK